MGSFKSVDLLPWGSVCESVSICIHVCVCVCICYLNMNSSFQWQRAWLRKVAEV